MYNVITDPKDLPEDYNGGHDHPKGHMVPHVRRTLLGDAIGWYRGLPSHKEDVADQLLELNYFGRSALPNVLQGFANVIVAWIESHPEEVEKHHEILNRLKAVRKSEDPNGQGNLNEFCFFICRFVVNF